MAYDVGGRGDQSFNDSAAAGMEKAVDELDATCTEAEAAGRRDRADPRGAPAHPRRGRLQPGHRASASSTRRRPPRSPRSTRTSTSRSIDGYSTSIPTATRSNERRRPDLRRGAGLLPRRRRRRAEVQGQARRLRRWRRTAPLIKKFEAGYIAGVEAVDPNIKVDVKYLTQDPTDVKPASRTRPGARPPPRACSTSGADVVYHAAGKSGLRRLRGGRGRGEGNWAIGVDSDQYLTADDGAEPHILTSMLKRVDVAVYDYVKAFDDGDVARRASTPTTWRSTASATPPSGGFVDDITAQIDDYSRADQERRDQGPDRPR